MNPKSDVEPRLPEANAAPPLGPSPRPLPSVIAMSDRRPDRQGVQWIHYKSPDP